MKKIIITTILIIGIIFITTSQSFAFICSQGNLLSHEYEEMICLLGCLCGIAFVMGVNQ